ncbi:hypothetical protein J3A83DRAFT_4312240 [Scleroderma citrinum]
MPFPFTFRLSVPGLHNPFLAAAEAQSKPGSRQTPASDRNHADQTSVYRPSSISTQLIPLPPHRRAFASTPYSLSPPVPLARKRGWVPSSPEPCEATTSTTSTNGYLDTPAKYRHMPEREPEREAEEMIADLPPAKRRRTLAGSIVSTALSAALIGTAVGLTVYRLVFDSWRDRGKDTPKLITNTDGTKDSEHLPPPPPYHRGNWVPVPEPTKQIEVTLPTPKIRSSRSRHHVSTPARRSAVRQRRANAKPHALTPPRGVSPSHSNSNAHPSLSSPPRSAFDFVYINNDRPTSQPEESLADPDFDEMDWIGDRLSQLIEEGQKALNREIVVMSDAKEDEVDDGTGNWEEEQDPSAVGPSISRRGSVKSLRRTQRPRELPLGHSSSRPSSLSPRKRRFEGDCQSMYFASGTPISPTMSHHTDRGVSMESDSHGSGYMQIQTTFREDESAWESAELRESMARARAQYLESRRI